MLETPTLNTGDLYKLMAEAQEVFETEWDPFPEPKLVFSDSQDCVECVQFDLDDCNGELPPASRRAQALTLWFKSNDLAMHSTEMQSVISKVLEDCPHTTIQIVLEPGEDPTRVTNECVEQLLAACYRQPNYLDRYYSLNPHGLLGSKRVLVLVDDARRDRYGRS